MKGSTTTREAGMDGWVPDAGHFAGAAPARCGCGNPAERDLWGGPRQCRTCRTAEELLHGSWAPRTLHRCPGCGQWQDAGETGCPTCGVMGGRDERGFAQGQPSAGAAALAAQGADLAAGLAAPAGRVALSPSETAAALGLARSTVEELIRRGEIPAKKVGQRWLVPVRGLAEWANDLRPVESAWLGKTWR